MTNEMAFITSKENIRAQTWLRLFGTSRLPVLHKRARWQQVNGRDTFAYDLYLAKLSQCQRDRFAAYVARKTMQRYVDVKRELDAAPAYPIPARGCTVEIEEAKTAVNQRPFLLYVPLTSALRIAINTLIPPSLAVGGIWW